VTSVCGKLRQRDAQPRRDGKPGLDPPFILKENVDFAIAQMERNIGISAEGGGLLRIKLRDSECNGLEDAGRQPGGGQSQWRIALSGNLRGPHRIGRNQSSEDNRRPGVPLSCAVQLNETSVETCRQ